MARLSLGSASIRAGSFVMGLLAITASVALGSPHVELEDVGFLAVDQPRVPFQLLEPTDPAGEGTLVGPTSALNSGLLDTGAQAVLLGQLAYADGETYAQETRDDTTEVNYAELGVAGTTLLDLHKPYDLVFAGSDGNPLVDPRVRSIGASTLSLGGFAGVVGTPAMSGRVTVLDQRPLIEPGLMDVDFPAAAPASTEDTYHLSLGKVPADPSSGRQQPGDPSPTLEALPTLDNTRLRDGANHSTRSMVVDTGGQVSLISSDTAAALNIDPVTDQIDQLDVGGIGGKATIPIVELDELTLPTEEGVDLQLSDLEVGVVDIEGLDGIIGMNVLTSGYPIDLSQILDGEADPGWFETVTFDLTDDEDWQLQLEMNPDFNHVVPEPGAAALLGLGSLLLLIRRKRAT